MTDNPTKLNPQEGPPPAPFLCPHCNTPGDQINMTPAGALAIFWHVACRKILNVQLMAIPQPRVQVPGLIKPS
jgi:hypothetical protein